MPQIPDKAELEAQIALLIKQAGNRLRETSVDTSRRASPPLQPAPEASQPTMEDEP